MNVAAALTRPQRDALLAAAASRHGRVMPTHPSITGALLEYGLAETIPDVRPVVVITQLGRDTARRHSNQQH